MSTTTATASTLWERFQNSDSRISLWLTDTRCTLAYAVSDLGATISRLGNRIHDDAPGDYMAGAADERTAAAMFSQRRNLIAENMAQAVTDNRAGRPVNLEHVDQFADAMGSDRATYRAIFEGGQR